MDVVSDDMDLLERVSQREDIKKLCKAVDEVLTAQERQVVIARYGLGGGAPLRQREVAKLTGISRSYVSRPGYCKRLAVRNSLQTVPNQAV